MFKIDVRSRPRPVIHLKRSSVRYRNEIELGVVELANVERLQELELQDAKFNTECNKNGVLPSSGLPMRRRDGEAEVEQAL